MLLLKLQYFYGKGNSKLTALTYYGGAKDSRYSIKMTGANTFNYYLFPNLSAPIESNVIINKDSLSTITTVKKGNYLKDASGKSIGFIIFGSNSGYTFGDSWRVNCRSNKGNNTFNGPTWWSDPATQKDGGFAKLPLNNITVGQVIKIDISESEGAADQPEQTFIASTDYVNIEEWFYEDQVYSKFKQYDEGGKNHGPFNVFLEL